jgi:hypothetical protein
MEGDLRLCRLQLEGRVPGAALGPVEAAAEWMGMAERGVDDPVDREVRRLPWAPSAPGKSRGPTLDIIEVEIAQVGLDRVQVRGARGHAAPEKLKATIGFLGDWFGEGEISYAGPNSFARAKLAGEVIGKRLDMRGLDLRRRIDLIGVSSAFDDDSGSLRDSLKPEVPDRAQDLRLRLAVAGPDKAAVEGALQEVLALYCCGPAGGGGQRSRITQRIETRSYLIPRETVEVTYQLE